MASFIARIGRAFQGATGVRKYLLVSTPFAVAGIYDRVRAGWWNMNLPDLPVWWIAAFAALLLLAFWFFQRIMALELKIEPNIKLNYDSRPPFVITEPSSPGALGTRLIRVEVENTGTEHLPACLLVLEAMTNKNGEPGFFTPIGMITQHQMLQKRKGGPFSLRGGRRNL